MWQGRGGPVGLQVVDGGGGSFARVGHRGPAWFGAVAVQIVSPLSLRRGGLGLGKTAGKMPKTVRKHFEGCEKPQKHATVCLTTGTGFVAIKCKRRRCSHGACRPPVAREGSMLLQYGPFGLAIWAV